MNDTMSKYEFMIQFIYIDLISHPKKLTFNKFMIIVIQIFLNNIFDKFFSSIF